MNQDIYFPMKSNIDFFEKQVNQPNLISKIKQSLLMYENLYFDAGAYTLSCGDRGSFNNYYPPEQLHLLDLDVPESTSKGFYVGIQSEPNGQPFYAIPPSKNSKNYIVCFQKLIGDMGLINEKFIKFGMQKLTDSGEKRLRDSMWNAREYTQYIEGEHFCKRVILENFYFSLLCSETIKTPMMIDGLHDKLIENTNKETIKTADMRLDIFNKINNFLKLRISDFSSLSIEEILDLRKDKSFKNFRTNLLNINEYLLKLDDEEELEIGSLFFNEILKEIKEFAPSKKDLILDGSLLMAGFLPYFGTAASAGGYVKELKSYNDFQNSSIAFIMKYKD